MKKKKAQRKSLAKRPAKKPVKRPKVHDIDELIAQISSHPLVRSPEETCKIYFIMTTATVGYLEQAVGYGFGLGAEIRSCKVPRPEAAVFLRRLIESEGDLSFMGEYSWVKDDLESKEDEMIADRVDGGIRGYEGTMDFDIQRPQKNITYTKELTFRFDKELNCIFLLGMASTHVRGPEDLWLKKPRSRPKKQLSKQLKLPAPKKKKS